MTSLSERLDSFPEAWRPTNAGEKLIGELTDVDLRESDYGEPYAVLTVLAEEGSTQDEEMIPPGTELTWHAFHAMARNAVRKKQPQVGERVGIVYAGTGEGTSDARRALVQGYAEGMKHGYELACREIAEQAQ